MDNIVDDYLTNLSWLKLPIPKDKRSKKVECMNHDIDDDLQCLCWLHQIQPRSSSHVLKRISITNKKYRNANRLISSTENTKDISSIRRISTLNTWNSSLFPSKTSSHQSFILIRLSNGKIFCLSIHENFH